MSTIFWTALGLVAFSYVGYFLLLLVWDGAREVISALRFVSGGADRRAGRVADAWPKVSIVFSAFDEEACIRQKIENCLALDYPADRLEIVVGCDGCTDRTAELARAAGGDRVTVHRALAARGKPAALSRLVPNAKGDVVVLTDANTMLEPGAVRALVRHFHDPSVGAVVGRLRLYNPTRARVRGEPLLEVRDHPQVLRGQARLRAGRERRHLRDPAHALQPAPAGHDHRRLRHPGPHRGARLDACPSSPTRSRYEETTEDNGREFGRRARIGAGNWQALARVPDLLDPRTGFVFFAFVSHKLLRWTDAVPPRRRARR